MEVKTKLVTTLAIHELFDFISGRADRLPREVLQILDVALRHANMMNPRCTPYRSSFFFAEDQDMNNRNRGIGGNAEVRIPFSVNSD